MNPGIRLSYLCSVLLLVSSCDRVKRFVEQAKEKICDAGNKAGAMTTSQATGDGKLVDPALQAEVDGAGGAYRFRKDLPFPPYISVRVTRRMEYLDGRLVQQSALGKQAVPLHAKLEECWRFDTSPGRVALTVEKAPHMMMEPVKDGTQAEPPPSPLDPGIAELEGKTVRFDKTEGRWKMEEPSGSRDFKCVAWGQSVERHLDDLLRAAGGMPGKMWFAPRARLAPGGVVNLRGDEVVMIAGSHATGKLKLALESVGSANGHPCGVFQVSGEISRKNAPSLDGSSQDWECSISSGRVWLSLLYPVVLKEDVQMVLSAAMGRTDGTMVRTEGTVHLIMEREWKVTSH